MKVISNLDLFRYHKASQDFDIGNLGGIVAWLYNIVSARLLSREA
jgi:hypothetical protein